MYFNVFQILSPLSKCFVLVGTSEVIEGENNEENTDGENQDVQGKQMAFYIWKYRLSLKLTPPKSVLNVLIQHKSLSF